MPSYKELQADFVTQNQAYAEYLADLRMRAQYFFADFKTYLSLPGDVMVGREGEHLPYVDLGREEQGRFVRCSRNDLHLDGSDLNFALQLNFLQDRIRAGIHFDIAISKRDVFYVVILRRQAKEFRVSGMNGNPDFTEVFELLTQLAQEQLRRRP